MWPNPQFSKPITEVILNENFHFLCSGGSSILTLLNKNVCNDSKEIFNWNASQKWV